VVDHLLHTLYKLVLEYNFSKAEIEKTDNHWKLVNKKDGPTTYAVLGTEDEANSCKQHLTELQNSNDLKKKTADIHSYAARIESKSKEMANLLGFICNLYGELDTLLHEEKQCPYCQVIFHPKNRSKT
jgi:hypothetical protein